MPKASLKAIFTILTLSQVGGKQIRWDRVVIILSTAVTVGLIALYVFGKITSRW